MLFLWVLKLDISYYQGQTYPNPPCWNLVADVYTREMKQLVKDFRATTCSVRDIATAFSIALRKPDNGFYQIPCPVEMCIVLMGKSDRLGVHHCGVYSQGSVLHALPKGVILQDMASLRDEYPIIEYWSKV